MGPSTAASDTTLHLIIAVVEPLVATEASTATSSGEKAGRVREFILLLNPLLPSNIVGSVGIGARDLAASLVIAALVGGLLVARLFIVTV